MPAWAEHMRFPVSGMLAVCGAAAALAGCGSGSARMYWSPARMY